MHRTTVYLLWLCLALIVASVCLAEEVAEPAGPVAWVELGSINVEHGLSLLNGADGVNEPATIGGSKCRRNVIDGDSPSHYLYFNYDSNVSRIRRPVYIIVEYFDEGFGFFRVQYDSADLSSPNRGAYKDSTNEILLDSRQWRKAVFELTDARFDNRQNLGADFRLMCSGQLAIRKVSIEMGHSSEFGKHSQEQRERIACCAGKLTPPKNVQIVFGAPEAAQPSDMQQVLADLKILAPMIKALGATSIETQVRWDFVESSPGRWDWRYYDAIVSILKENGLKWSPCIVIDPAYATPSWYQASNHSVSARCLEHNEDSKTQSIWNPDLPLRVDQFLMQFGEHFGSSNQVESVLIGISGDFGEAAFPNASEGWIKNAAEEHHTHTGFWCGDDYARSDFQRYIEGQYGKIDALNAAWKTSFASFEEVTPFVPDETHSSRARLDFLNWYRGRMTKWASYWLDTARIYLPRTALYLCTGGDGQPAHGVDLSAQCKAAGKVEAGVRLISETQDYAMNFALTRLAVSASRHYGAYYSFEPATLVSAEGLPARFYNSVTSKARGLHTHYPTVLVQPGGITSWRNEYHRLGSPVTRRPAVALLYPRTSLSLKWGGFYEKAMLLRDAFAFDIVDESMIQDEALKRYRVLVIAAGQVFEEKDAARIVSWVESGGVLVTCDLGGFYSVEGTESTLASIFDTASGRSPAVKEVGEGLAIYIAKGWSNDDTPVAAIVEALDSLGTRVQVNLVPDGAVDRVYVSDLGGYLLAYNAGSEDVERELQVGIGRRQKVKLPAGQVTKIITE